jgi:hypothetical protein
MPSPFEDLAMSQMVVNHDETITICVRMIHDATAGPPLNENRRSERLVEIANKIGFLLLQ